MTRIASGYHTVTKDTLRRLGKDKAKEFIYEMFTHGGTIGHYEYLRWLDWIEISL